MKKIQNELSHSGRKGMHWGVRHGPPYPLKAGVPLSEMAQKRKAKRKEARMLKKVNKVRKNPKKIAKLNDEEVEYLRKRTYEESAALRNLEYADNYNNKSRSSAQKAVSTVMSSIGSRIVVPAIVGIAGLGLRAVVSRAIDTNRPSVDPKNVSSSKKKQEEFDEKRERILNAMFSNAGGGGGGKKKKQQKQK